MKKRIDELLNRITRCKLLADVGCDHGFLGYYALKRGLCERLIASDVSLPSLRKAEKLLAEYIDDGRAEAIVSDGFSAYREVPDEAAICGMGGEETVKVLTNFSLSVPYLVLQPMKNADKLRRYLLNAGYGITEDRVFFIADKKYDVICAKIGEASIYDEAELFFGRDNLIEPTDEFIAYLSRERDKYIALKLSDKAAVYTSVLSKTTCKK